MVWDRETAPITADDVLAEDVDAATGADPATQVAVMLYLAVVPEALMKSLPLVVSDGIWMVRVTVSPVVVLPAVAERELAAFILSV